MKRTRPNENRHAGRLSSKYRGILQFDKRQKRSTTGLDVFIIPETRTSVEYPSSIFSENAGRPPEGGMRLMSTCPGPAQEIVDARILPRANEGIVVEHG